MKTCAAHKFLHVARVVAWYILTYKATHSNNYNINNMYYNIVLPYNLEYINLGLRKWGYKMFFVVTNYQIIKYNIIPKYFQVESLSSQGAITLYFKTNLKPFVQSSLKEIVSIALYQR